MSEGEKGGDILLVIMPVSHVNAFPVNHPVPVPRVKPEAGIVLQSLREGFGQFPGGADFPEQDPGHGMATLLTGIIGFQYGRYFVDPGHGQGSTVDQDHDGVWIGPGDSADQSVLLSRERKALPVLSAPFVKV